MSPLVDDDQVRNSRELDVEADAEDMEADSNGEDDSSDEEKEYGNRKSKVPVRPLLDKILKSIREGTRDLTRCEQFESFRESDGVHLAANTGNPCQPTALHIMAGMDKTDLPKLDSQMKTLIEFLVQHRDNLLKVQDRSGHTPLFLAIESKNKRMVQWMCDAHANISTILAITSRDKMNCIHIGIDKRVKFLDLLIERADPATLAAKNGDGNTPLHLAVEYKNFRKEQLAAIERIVTKSDEEVQKSSRDGDFNDAGHSPFTHHKESIVNAAAKEKKSSKAKMKHEECSVYSLPDSSGVDGPTAIEPEPGRTEGKPSSYRHPNIRFPQNRESRLHTMDRDEIEQLLELHISQELFVPPSSPGFGDGKKTACQLGPLLNGGVGAKAVSDGGHRSPKVDEATIRSVEQFIKLHYLRSRSYNAAMEILYGHNTTSVKNLLSKLKFEDILQYVAIPRICVEATMNDANSKRSRVGSRLSKTDINGRKDLCCIFDCLRKKGVKTILKVVIDDSVMPAHSDEAIEAALKDMNVEVWDWNKTNLCSEVIYNVAPCVREVHLYWSGNNAVLRGWSEPGGLRRLRELRKVCLHVQQGLESRSRMERNFDEFCIRMEKLCPEVTIKPEWPIIQRARANTDAARAEEDQADDTWIKCMRDFRKLLFDAERQHEHKIEHNIEEPIKVALIDDGVDVKDLEYTFIGGRTFCTRDERHSLNNPYYVSSTGHGTNMAKQIHLLCPRAQFYVLRLEDHPSEEGGRQLTVKSATQAIHAAILKKVHIISMSWTIDPPERDDERRHLENAIHEAAKADILMFCSASDKGANQIATYPAKATGKIFVIGAATASGVADPWVGNLSNINFTFPGDNTETGGGPGGDTKSKEIGGSSVATALASGLAALILYCVQVRLLLAPDHEKQKARQGFQALKRHEHMMRAFKDIGTTEESNHKFIKVWEVFGKKVEEKEQDDPKSWINLVAEVGNTLCRRI